MTTPLEARFVAVADHALLIEFASEYSEAANERVVSLDRAIDAAELTGVRELVPALVNLLVVFDPIATDHAQLENAVRTLLPTPSVAAEETARHVVQVCYEDPFAPDLAAVAESTGLSADAVIAAHGLGEYRVLMYGFAPGYAYLGGVPDEIHVPRKPAAVRDVAASSILIAGGQCIVTPTLMPTGWSVIGRSTTEVLRDNPERPFLFGLGDEITFERVGAADFGRLTQQGKRGVTS